MFELFFKGGPIMILLFFCSIAGTYIIVNKYLFLHVNFNNAEKIIDIIKTKLTSYGKEKTILELRTVLGEHFVILFFNIHKP